MMELITVLRESFTLLFSSPKLFVPKLVSTITASLFLVYMLSGREALATLSPVILVFFMMGSLLAISIIGVFSSMMLSSMVRGGEISLLSGFKSVFFRFSNVLITSLVILFAGFTVSILMSLGYLAYLSTGSIAVLAVSVVLFLLVLIGISYASYFLPITLLDGGFRDAVSNSYSASRENNRMVITLLVFSLALITLAFASTGVLEKLGYAGFVLGRVISSIINTYIFVVSPKYYIESENG